MAPMFRTALAAVGKKEGKKKGERGQEEGDPQPEEDERLRNIDARLIEVIENEILVTDVTTRWSDVAGLAGVKQAMQETVILPMKYPQLFTGLRKPCRGILMFGPPGTGKTMVSKALAAEAGCTFFNISASSLTSKWLGDSEKLTRALFAVARVRAPSIIFIDEIDSLLTKRGDNDHEASRRIKTEFLLQFDGIASGDEPLVVVGATNRPQDLDEAARRRFAKRIYIPLPDSQTRLGLVELLLSKTEHEISGAEMRAVVESTEGYSCADITCVMKDAAMIPVRELDFSAIGPHGPAIRSMTFADVQKALRAVRRSVSPESVREYLAWDREFGYGS